MRCRTVDKYQSGSGSSLAAEILSIAKCLSLTMNRLPGEHLSMFFLPKFTLLAMTECNPLTRTVSLPALSL